MNKKERPCWAAEREVTVEGRLEEKGDKEKRDMAMDRRSSLVHGKFI